MKHWWKILILFFAAIGVGCHQRTSKHPDSEATVKKNLTPITITLTETSSYCGGARPSQEILDELNQPKPRAGVKVFIGKSITNNSPEKNIIDSKISNEKGEVEFLLEPGDYYLIYENKLDNTYIEQLARDYSKASQSFTAIDNNCLKQWKEEPELVIQVGKEPQKFDLNYVVPCFWNSIPCVNYIGPLPP